MNSGRFPFPGERLFHIRTPPMLFAPDKSRISLIYRNLEIIVRRKFKSQPSKSRPQYKNQHQDY